MSGDGSLIDDLDPLMQPDPDLLPDPEVRPDLEVLSDPEILPDPENHDTQDTQIQGRETEGGAPSMVNFRPTLLI